MRGRIMDKTITAIGTLSTSHIIFLSIIIILVIFVLWTNGINIKLGDKEVHFGGINKRLSDRDKDARIRESLKKDTDDIDREVLSSVEDIIDDMDYRISQEFPDNGEHCWFTLEKLTSIVKQELYKRARRNNLKVRLCETSKEQYVTKIMNNVKERYTTLQAKAAIAKCGDTYPDFSEVENVIHEEVVYFFDEAKKVEIEGMKQKISLYERNKSKFKLQ